MRKFAFLTTIALFLFTVDICLANSFSELPKNHWSYGAVAKLAQTRVVEGYENERFLGNKAMTRYQMAQIVAKAMANYTVADKQNSHQIEKLSLEFASELALLGIKTKRLEKDVDNVKLLGEARFLYQTFKRKFKGRTVQKRDSFRLRTRLWLAGQINERWSYGSMMENHQNLLSNSRTAPVYNGMKESEPVLMRAWVKGKVGEVEVTAGRFFYVPLYGTVIDEDGDGIKLKWSKEKWSTEVFAFRPELGNAWLEPVKSNNVQVLGSIATYVPNKKLNINLAHYNVDAKKAVAGKKLNIFEIGADYMVTDKLMLWAQYVRGDSTENPAYAYFSKNGWVAGAKYGNKKRSQPGSFELNAAWYDVPALGTVVVTTKLNTAENGFGQKGIFLDVNVVVAKNIDFSVEYYDFRYKEKDLSSNKAREKMLWTYMRFYF